MLAKISIQINSEILLNFIQNIIQKSKAQKFEPRSVQL